SFRTGLSSLIPFAAGLTTCGICPVLVNQHFVAGAWYLPTYSEIDATFPNGGVLGRTIAFYLAGGEGAQDNWALLVGAAGFTAVAALTRRRTSQAAERSPILARTAIASFLAAGVPLAFFLTHNITMSYYVTPSVFAAVTLLAAGALIGEVDRSSSPRP